MATTVYFTSAVPDWSRGQGDADLLGTTRNWTQQSLAIARGSGVTSQTRTSIAGPTTGIEAGTSFEWISEPLDADITISGSVTFNLWGIESVMTAEAGIGCILQRLDSQGAIISTIADNSEVGIELGTASAVRNESSSPTSTNMLKGDRIRARVYFNDAVTTTMVAAATLTFRYNGVTAAADGDSYITFTENFGFLGSPVSQEDATALQPFQGSSGTTEAVAQSFVNRGGTITQLGIYLDSTGTPTDNVLVALQADSSGSPSGTDLVSASMAASGVSGTGAWYTFDTADYEPTADGTYWIVVTRSGARSTSNYVACGFNGTVDVYTGGAALQRNSSTWSALNYDIRFRIYYGGGSALYLTDTASAVDPNGATYDAKEAWTSRGSGVVAIGTDDVTGPTAPLLARVSVGGNFIEWFSKPLTAFTLSGLVACNMRAGANAAANAAIRAELAVCATDGTTPVVWGAANDGIKIPSTSENVMTFNVAGDNTAITDGQRLRIRVYFDDAPGAAMAVSANNLDLYYAGTSAAASGDTYIMLPQTVTEYSAGGAASLIYQSGMDMALLVQ